MSYQGDQIYTFNIHDQPQNNCYSGVGIGPRTVLGGHVNYATFLKTVSFYGPQDEYIVTGSDNGCIWIYDSSSGVICTENQPAVPCRVINVLRAGMSLKFL